MTTNIQEQQLKKALEETIKLKMKLIFNDLLKGNTNAKEFTKSVNLNYSIKKMELTGKLF